MEARRRDYESGQESSERQSGMEPREYRQPREHLEPVERESYQPESRMYDFRDTVQWGAVWTGLLGAMGLLVLLAFLGLAVGLGAAPNVPADQLGTSSAIWGGAIIVVSFFFGGWLAGRTSSVRGNNFAGWVLGSMVWALGVLLLALLAGVGLGGLLGANFSMFGGIRAPDATAAANAQGSAVAAFATLLVAYIASIIGSMVGSNHRARDYRPR